MTEYLTIIIQFINDYICRGLSELLMVQFDANGDGVLDRTEYAALEAKMMEWRRQHSSGISGDDERRTLVGFGHEQQTASADAPMMILSDNDDDNAVAEEAELWLHSQHAEDGPKFGYELRQWAREEASGNGYGDGRRTSPPRVSYAVGRAGGSPSSVSTSASSSPRHAAKLATAMAAAASATARKDSVSADLAVGAAVSRGDGAAADSGETAERVQVRAKRAEVRARAFMCAPHLSRYILAYVSCPLHAYSNIQDVRLRAESAGRSRFFGADSDTEVDSPRISPRSTSTATSPTAFSPAPKTNTNGTEKVVSSRIPAYMRPTNSQRSRLSPRIDTLSPEEEAQLDRRVAEKLQRQRAFKASVGDSANVKKMKRGGRKVRAATAFAFASAAASGMPGQEEEEKEKKKKSAGMRFAADVVDDATPLQEAEQQQQQQQKKEQQQKKTSVGMRFTEDVVDVVERVPPPSAAVSLEVPAPVAVEEEQKKTKKKKAPVSAALAAALARAAAYEAEAAKEATAAGTSQSATVTAPMKKKKKKKRVGGMRFAEDIKVEVHEVKYEAEEVLARSARWKSIEANVEDAIAEDEAEIAAEKEAALQLVTARTAAADVAVAACIAAGASALAAKTAVGEAKVQHYDAQVAAAAAEVDRLAAVAARELADAIVDANIVLYEATAAAEAAALAAQESAAATEARATQSIIVRCTGPIVNDMLKGRYEKVKVRRFAHQLIASGDDSLGEAWTHTEEDDVHLFRGTATGLWYVGDTAAMKGHKSKGWLASTASSPSPLHLQWCRFEKAGGTFAPSGSDIASWVPLNGDDFAVDAAPVSRPQTPERDEVKARAAAASVAAAAGSTAAALAETLPAQAKSGSSSAGRMHVARPRTPERRVAADGNVYTHGEFVQHYGGSDQWEVAPVAAKGRAAAAAVAAAVASPVPSAVAKGLGASFGSGSGSGSLKGIGGGAGWGKVKKASARTASARAMGALLTEVRQVNSRGMRK